MQTLKQISRWKDLSLGFIDRPEKPYVVSYKGTITLDAKFDTLQQANQRMFDEAFLRYGDLICLVPAGGTMPE